MERAKAKATQKRGGVATSLRISPDGLKLWDRLAADHGLNRTAFLEMTLRRLAKEKGLSEDGQVSLP